MSIAPTSSPRRPFRSGVVVGLALVAALAAGCSKSDGGATANLSAAGKRGQTVAMARGCTACHSAGGSRGTGPTWKDLAGSEVKLDNGTKKADDAYLRQAITAPRSEVVSGFPNIMPNYSNLTADQVNDIIAYLHDLSAKH
jgi:cytochrome c oxidase subunit 2